MPRLHIRLGEYVKRYFHERVKLLRVYDCLCDATRLRLLNLLAQRPLCVCHFEAVLRVPQARISRHLAYLRRHGLVTSAQQGRWRIYALASPAPAELAANLVCLQAACATERVLQQDLRRLERLSAQNDCGCSVPGAPRREVLRLTHRS
jgi:ArsR family transcriptional regulator, arsenate/arsenite/antimonite-responsive transcriptional repressor